MNADIPRKIADFFADYPLRTFTKRQLIARADEPIAQVFYMVEGQASQYDIAPNGNEIVVNVFKPGAFFPMSTAINQTPNQYFFEVRAGTKLHVAPAQDAVQFLRDNPDIAFNLLARVYRGVDGVLRRMAHLMGGSAESRLLFELLNAAQRFATSQPDGSLHIPLTEGDIAKRSGLARETVNRTLQKLKASGLVTVTPDGIVVTSLAQLDAVLGSAL